MNLRHAVALSLAGWYLMVPPAMPDGKPDGNAPLWQWTQADEFDNADACHKAYNDRLALAIRAVDQIKQKIDSLPDSVRHSSKPFSELEPELFKADLKISIFALNAGGSQCIASDDPRLKSN